MLYLTRQLSSNGVWKAAGAYILLTIVFMAAAYGVVDVLGISVMYARFTGVIAALGFPLALVLAWALGAAPQSGATRVGAPTHPNDVAVKVARAVT